jgi:hypothetical protein
MSTPRASSFSYNANANPNIKEVIKNYYRMTTMDGSNCMVVKSNEIIDIYIILP